MIFEKQSYLMDLIKNKLVWIHIGDTYYCYIYSRSFTKTLIQDIHKIVQKLNIMLSDIFQWTIFMWLLPSLGCVT